MEERAREAARIRATSNSRTRLKPEDIMDVTQDEVVRVLSECGATRMIHGHTHRPGVHEIDLATGRAARIVLGDWYDRGMVLAWDEAGWRLVSPERLST